MWLSANKLLSILTVRGLAFSIMAHTNATVQNRTKSKILLRVDMRNSDSLYVCLFMDNDVPVIMSLFSFEFDYKID